MDIKGTVISSEIKYHTHHNHTDALEYYLSIIIGLFQIYPVRWDFDFWQAQFNEVKKFFEGIQHDAKLYIMKIYYPKHIQIRSTPYGKLCQSRIKVFTVYGKVFAIVRNRHSSNRRVLEGQTRMILVVCQLSTN